MMDPGQAAIGASAGLAPAPADDLERWLLATPDLASAGQPVPSTGLARPLSDDPALAEPEPLHRTDAGNGEHFARRYADQVRYDHRRNAWLLWGDHWWTVDDRGVVRRLAKEAARDRYQQAIGIEDLGDRATEAKFAVASENRQRIDAMLLAARSEPPIADAGRDWNSDPWLLGVANGVVDLRTGTLRPGEPRDRITFHSSIGFEPDARCPRWEQFLDEVFGGDLELIGFIARAVGYSLTGDTREQCLFTCHGSGSNGKTTFLKVLHDLAGDYGANTPFSTFELHSRSAIPNDVAALAERRLVTASETAEGTRLNEARMKALTGGDEITARFLHGEFFSFRPAAKFWLAVNHKPRVSDDSYGFWRRVRLIPFLRRFTDDGDQRLPLTLEGELPGILAWAVRGALAWQAEGLRPPVAVTSATETYRVESDPLADFLEACCVEGPGFEVAAAVAFRAYQSWADDQGMSTRERLTSTAFGTRLGDRYAKRKTKTGRVYLGVGLLAARTGSPGTPPVTGSVAGLEHEPAESEVSSLVEPLTREDLVSGVTTRHPSPAVDEAMPVELDYPRSAYAHDRSHPLGSDRWRLGLGARWSLLRGPGPELPRLGRDHLYRLSPVPLAGATLDAPAGRAALPPSKLDARPRRRPRAGRTAVLTPACERPAPLCQAWINRW